MQSLGWAEIITITGGFVGGIGMFLYGMTILSEGLQKTAGERLKKVLEKLTSNRYAGAGVGIVVTMLLQSSTASTVMVVGFVNAGLMTLMQALSVVVGANVGTTVTAMILTLNVKAMALPAIGIGSLFYVFSKNIKVRNASQIMLGFGLLFFGMSIMTELFKGLSTEESFQRLFTGLSGRLWLAVIAGTLATILFQSSAAMVGVTMALGTSGLIDLPVATALILGDNLGTTITANIAAMGGSRTARQAAFGHFIYNLAGVTYIFILIYPFMKLVASVTTGDHTFMAADGTYPYMKMHIANTHLIFNLINALVCLPMLGLLAKVCEFVIKTDEKQTYQYTKLSDTMMKAPEIAALQLQREVTSMFSTTMKMLRQTEEAVLRWDLSMMDEAILLEKNLVGQRDELILFTNHLQNQQLDGKTQQVIEGQRRAIASLEEIGNLVIKLIGLTSKMLNKNQELSSSGKKELNEMFDLVLFFAGRTFNAFSNTRMQSDDELAIEDEIDRLHKQFRKNHIKRLKKGKCTIDMGISFVDILNLLENIGDAVFDVAQVNVRQVSEGEFR